MLASPQSTGRRPAVGRALSWCALLPLLAACGLPTEIPQLDQRWITPAQTTVIGVARLLPAGVQVVPDSSAFAVDLPPVTITRTLGADCSACATANGTTVPKPAFVVNASASTPLPPNIVSATLSGGTLSIAVQNSYPFDPLRPSATARGYVVITVTNGTQVIGRDSVNGATVALPSGGSLTRAIPLAGPVSSASPVVIAVKMDSPAGDAVQMDASRLLVVNATPSNLRVASAVVDVFNRQITSTAHIDLSDVDESIRTHLTGGALRLAIDNPFSIGGTMTVQFTAPGVTTVLRTLSLGAGVTNISLPLSQSELQSLMGHDVGISYDGLVTGTTGPLTVTPRQVLTVRSRLDLTLHTGTPTP